MTSLIEFDEQKLFPNAKPALAVAAFNETFFHFDGEAIRLRDGGDVNIWSAAGLNFIGFNSQADAFLFGAPQPFAFSLRWRRLAPLSTAPIDFCHLDANAFVLFESGECRSLNGERRTAMNGANRLYAIGKRALLGLRDDCVVIDSEQERTIKYEIATESAIVGSEFALLNAFGAFFILNCRNLAEKPRRIELPINSPFAFHFSPIPFTDISEGDSRECFLAIESNPSAALLIAANGDLIGRASLPTAFDAQRDSLFPRFAARFHNAPPRLFGFVSALPTAIADPFVCAARYLSFENLADADGLAALVDALEAPPHYKQTGTAMYARVRELLQWALVARRVPHLVAVITARDGDALALAAPTAFRNCLLQCNASDGLAARKAVLFALLTRERAEAVRNVHEEGLIDFLEADRLRLAEYAVEPETSDEGICETVCEKALEDSPFHLAAYRRVRRGLPTPNLSFAFRSAVEKWVKLDEGEPVIDVGFAPPRLRRALAERLFAGGQRASALLTCLAAPLGTDLASLLELLLERGEVACAALLYARQTPPPFLKAEHAAALLGSALPPAHREAVERAASERPSSEEELIGRLRAGQFEEAARAFSASHSTKAACLVALLPERHTVARGLDDVSSDLHSLNDE